MPDMFGNPTPAEVMQRLTQERDTTINSAGSNPNDRRNAIMFALGRMASPSTTDPRLERANSIEGALAKSLALTRNDGESQLDFEIRRQRQMFDDVKHVDPTTAADVSSSLVKLETEKAEQYRLQQGEERAQRADTRQETEQKIHNINDGLWYKVDMSDPFQAKVTGDTMWVDDKNFGDKLQESREAGGKYEWMNARELRTHQINTRPADLKLLGSDQSARESELQNATASADLSNRLATLFVNAKKEAGTNPMTFIDALTRGIQPAVEAASELSRRMGGGSAPQAGSSQYAEDLANAEKYMQEHGVLSGVPASLMVRLAYTWAASFDHRVSDNDFKKAFDMIGASSGNPAQMIANIREQTFGQHESLVGTIDTITQSLEDENADVPNSIGRKQAHLLRNLRVKYDDAKKRFEDSSNELMGLYGANDRFNNPPGTQKTKPDGKTGFKAKNGRQFSTGPGFNDQTGEPQ